MSNNLIQFFPNGFNPSKYVQQIESNEPPNIQAWNHLKSMGYAPPFIKQGEMMRFPDAYDLAKGDKKGQGGWAIYNEINIDSKCIGFLTYGSWHEGDKKTWSSVNSERMDSNQLTAYHEAIESAKKVRDAEESRIKEKAQAEFNREFPSLAMANANHPYLVKKGIKPVGIRQDGDKLVIPCYLGDKLVGLQDIYPDGQKFFRKYSTKGYFLIGDKDAENVFICEGYATGASIYEAVGGLVAVAFDAGNLFPTASALKDKYNIVICADDDKHGEVNTGLTKAKLCQDSLGCRVLSPICDGTDFNDMHSEKGLEAVRAHILTSLEIKQPAKTSGDRKEDALRPIGALGSIYDYYNATSGYNQKGFAIQTALAICSVVCGRNFKTNNDNFASIYLLNVGKTSTGKEHCKTVVNRILESVNMDNIIIGDGFTSSGAVMTELLRKPRCISIIDEFGMYMEAAGAKGNANQKEANSYIMQAISRAHSTMTAKNYSAMTTGGKTDINDRKVYNPALTLVGITTPDTFFSAITGKEIHSGFLNRFIVSISKTERAVRNDVEAIDVPASIKDWLFNIQKRATFKNPIEVPVERPNFVEIQISQAAKDIQRAFDQEMVDAMNEHESDGLDGVFGRAAEMAHRVALIHALSRNPYTEIIADIDMEWAVKYIRNSYQQMADAVAKNICENQFDKDKSDIVQFIEAQPDMEARKTEILKRFRKHTSFQMEEILKNLVDSEILVKEIRGGSKGRPSDWYVRME